MKGIVSIEIDFGAPVEMSSDHQRRLVELMDEVCAAYESANPGRTMWAGGIGQKCTDMWSEEPTFDEAIFHIECMERASHPGESRASLNRGDQ